MSSFISFENVEKRYGTGEVSVQALHDASFTIEKGEICVIVGPSGAGKTTLLNILGGMDTLTSGQVFLDGREVSAFNSRQLADYRRRDIGFVFQFYNLIPTLTVKENVALVSEIAPKAFPAEKMIEEVGLKDHLNNFPSELSGGEQQRVSIARALAKNPKILLCDEPTGALDSETGVLVLKLLLSMAKNYGKTIIVVTHNQSIAKMADVVVRVKNGKIKSVEENSSPMSADEVDW